MQITIDIIVAGCATNCWHCYVGGGPGARMPLDRFRLTLRELASVRDHLAPLDLHPDFCLDYEPLLHPDLCQMLGEAQERFALDLAFEDWPTTGIPLASRRDWRRVLTCLKAAGVNGLSFTVHGPGDLHDRAVRHRGAFEKLALAAERAAGFGFATDLTLNVTKPMLRRFEETLRAVEEIRCDPARAIVCNYQANQRLRAFEPYRPGLADVLPYRRELDRFSSAQGRWADWWPRAEDFAESAVRQNVLAHPENFPSFAAVERRMPDWLFLCVDRDLTLFRGNAGLQTQRIGRLGQDDPQRLAERIAAMQPNYQFGAFYDLADLPAPADLAERFGLDSRDALYQTTEDAMLVWLDRWDKTCGYEHNLLRSDRTYPPPTLHSFGDGAVGGGDVERT